MAKLLSILILCIFSAFVSANPTFRFGQPVSSFIRAEGTTYRLDNNTEPINYQVHLKTRVDEAKFDFQGEVKITLKFKVESNYVQIHKRQITITNATIKCGSDAEELLLEKMTFNEVTEHLRFNLTKAQPVSTQCVLWIEYNGELREDNEGFYRSSYVNPQGQTRWLATTQFESTDARHAFPCYDEPGMRATFDIKITFGDENYHAISNAEIDSTVNNPDGTRTTTFKQTPLVQPYLIAFVVSDFKFVERNLAGVRVPQKLFARPAAIDAGEGEYGVETGIEILTDQANYFGVPYGLPKMDQISIPDFSAGAMENWGLVTYREELLLYNEDRALSQKKRIAEIIAHEFAHQWFGNWVAPEWWSYLWLNEGFANMYEYYSISRLYKDWDIMGFFIFENHQTAMRADALETTRPMTHYVEDPVSVRNLFDSIAYDKSGSVLRMIQHSLTDDLFKKGLNYYLTERGLKAANSDHLAAGLQKAVDEAKPAQIPAEITMKRLIDSWSLKAGYPLVTVTRGDDNKLTFTQTKFSYKVNTTVDGDWLIPINYATASKPWFNDTKPVAWMTGKTMSHTIQGSTTDDWIVVNLQETGFYRVDYDEKLWQLIINKLKSPQFEEIHEFNRAQLVDDVLNLARANIQKYPAVFTLLEYLEQEKNFVPWASASNGLGFLDRQLLGSGSYEYFQRFVGKLVAPLYAKLTSHDGGPNERLADKTARTIAIDWACRTGDAKCIAETRDRVQQVIQNSTLEIEPDVRYNIYCNGLRQATETDYNAIIERLKKETDQNERTILLNALGCIQVSDIQKKYLDASIDRANPVGLRVQERNRVLQSVYSNGQTGLENSIEFLEKNHAAVQELYNPPSPVKNNAIRMSERVTSPELNEKFEKMMNTLVAGKYFTAEEKDKVMETPKENLAWIEENEKEISEFFANYFKNNANVSVVSTVFLSVLLAFTYLLQ
uniref:Aminopeptidase n=1 Tax=Culicoides sonorensis TaxID=179676 RepID=A0A336LYN8_CULSO